MRNDITSLGENAATFIATFATYIRDEITSDHLSAGITRLVLGGAAKSATLPSFDTLASTLSADVLRGLSKDQAFLTSDGLASVFSDGVAHGSLRAARATGERVRRPPR